MMNKKKGRGKEEKEQDDCKKGNKTWEKSVTMEQKCLHVSELQLNSNNIIMHVHTLGKEESTQKNSYTNDCSMMLQRAEECAINLIIK